jgi:hypothetical protein
MTTLLDAILGRRWGPERITQGLQPAPHHKQACVCDPRIADRSDVIEADLEVCRAPAARLPLRRSCCWVNHCSTMRVTCQCRPPSSTPSCKLQSQKGGHCSVAATVQHPNPRPFQRTHVHSANPNLPFPPIKSCANHQGCASSTGGCHGTCQRQSHYLCHPVPHPWQQTCLDAAHLTTEAGQLPAQRLNTACSGAVQCGCAHSQPGAGTCWLCMAVPRAGTSCFAPSCCLCPVDCCGHSAATGRHPRPTACCTLLFSLAAGRYFRPSLTCTQLSCHRQAGRGGRACPHHLCTLPQRSCITASRHTQKAPAPPANNYAA